MKMRMFRFVMPLILVIIAITAFAAYYGTPWAKKEFENSVNSYLLENYDIKMNLVSKPSYSLELGTYSVLGSPQGMEDITFAIYQNQSDKHEIDDRFLLEYWTYQANEDINEIIDSMDLKEEAVGKFIITGGDKDTTFKTRGVPPSFEEVKYKLKKGTSIYISFTTPFDDKEIKSIVDDLYNLLLKVRGREYYFENLNVTYELEEKGERIWLQFNYDKFYQSLTWQHLFEEISQ
ncbi:hypothetical protein ACX93W_08400 [Paenibacillus sp. CAU 1782]